MCKTTLVVLAAGMGSRFGGFKQMEPVSENGSVLLQFSAYDAIKAGFNKIVFIIKEEMYEDFKRVVGDKITGAEVDYVFQETTSLPKGRTKPWGTGHAILCCKDKVTTPFAVINADDYYGRNAYKELHDYLAQDNKNQYAMVTFELKNTLTDNGTVARGICDIVDGKLVNITERTKIKDMRYTEDGENWISLPEDTYVSMNLWGFTTDIFDVLEEKFEQFRSDLKDPMKDEFFLPFVVDECIKNNTAEVKVFYCRDKWYGMTYREDIESVKEAVTNMIAEGYYEGL